MANFNSKKSFIDVFLVHKRILKKKAKNGFS